MIATESGQRLVVKRFFKVSDSESEEEDDDPLDPVTPVTVQENKTLIYAECVRLALGRMFLQQFYTFAKSKQVNVYSRKSLSKFFIAVPSHLRMNAWPQIFLSQRHLLDKR